MKRDLDLLRQILFYFEARNEVSAIKVNELHTQMDLTDVSVSELVYHLRLMAQADLLVCETTRSSTSDRIIAVLPFELSWAGHEFLQLSREESTWNKVKKGLGGSFKAITFDILKALLVAEAKRHVGLLKCRSRRSSRP